MRVIWYANGVTAILAPVVPPPWALARDCAALVWLLGLGAMVARGRVTAR